MSWIKKLFPSKVGAAENGEKKGVPEGIWTKCGACSAVLYRVELERNLMVCPKCNHHIRVTARQRLEMFLDPAGREELAIDVTPVDILKFRDSKKYKDRLAAAQKKSGEKDALVVMRGAVHGLSLVASAFDFGFIGGSMGAAVGERFVQGVNTCIEHHLPLVNFSNSGGARMQEGLTSLLQMAKTSTALAKLSQQHLPFISVLIDPTMGGVSASLAMLGDIIIAEPKALIGFAGPRVIEQTVRQILPEGFQRSEFLLEHGAIDMIVERKDLRDRIAGLLAKMMHTELSPITSEPETAA